MNLSPYKSWSTGETLTSSDLNNSILQITNHTITNSDLDSTGNYVLGTLVIGTGLSSADGKLHVHTASAGSITANGDADELVLENSGTSGLTVLSGTSSAGSIFFGDSGDNDIGKISYSHSSNALTFTTNATTALTLSSAQAATFASTIASGAITATNTTAPLILKYDAEEYVTHAVSSAGVYSITTTDASSDSGAITLDTVDSITLDSDTASEGVVYADGGTNLLRISNSSSDVIFKPLVDSKDLVFQQYDGNEVARIADNRRLYLYDEGGEYLSSDGSNLTIASGSAAWVLPASDGSANQVLKTNGSGTLSWTSVADGTIGGSTGSMDNIILTANGTEGATLQANSAIAIDDSSNISGINSITLADSKEIIFGTNSDIKIEYDEATYDSLLIQAGVNDAGVGIVLSADASADNGDTWKINAANGGVLTFGNDISGSMATGITVTPHATATSWELAFVGEISADSLDIEGNVDVNGVLESDSITVGGTNLTALYSPIAGSSSIVTVGTVSTGTWQGTAIASAYLDSDTAHLSGTQTFTGAKTFTGTVTTGVNDTGVDVKFFGASAGAFMLWDESADTLEVRGKEADSATSQGTLKLTTALTNINDNDRIGQIDFQTPLEAGGTDAILVGARIHGEAEATFAADNNSTAIVFSTNTSAEATERFRITSAGAFTGAGDIESTSDIRTKENIKTIENPVSIIKQIRGVTFNKIDTPDKESTGVIAQEVEAAGLTQVVSTNHDGMKTVAYGNMVGLLIEAIKEQQQQIDDLKARECTC